MKAPLEGLLRPPVEFISATTYGAAALLLAFAPERLFLLPMLAYPGAVFLALLSWRRYLQGARIRRYHKALRFLPMWELTPTEIPLSRNNLFLGRGFLWTALHTQRLYDALKPENAHYALPSKLYEWARRKEIALEGQPSAERMLRLLRQPWRIGPLTLPNPFGPRPDLGGYSCIHGVGMVEGEQDIYQALADRVGHTFVCGTTRVGKTRLLEVLVNQDIRRGDCVIVIDPKGDAELLKSMYLAAKAVGREGDFQVFHLGSPTHSCRYNPIGDVTRITEVSTRVARQLPGEGQSATFREFVWGYCNGIATATAALGRRSDYRMLESYSNDLEPLVIEYLEHVVTQAIATSKIQNPGDWRATLKKHADARDEQDRWIMKVPYPMRDRGRYAVALVQWTEQLGLVRGTAGAALVKLFSYDPGYYSKLVASLLPFLAKLTTGRVGELLAPDYDDPNDKRPILSWMSFLRQNGIIYVGLDALSDPDVAAVVGSTMFSDLVSTLGVIYKHGYGYGGTGEAPVTRHIRLHADEFSDLIREDFIPLLNKGGGTGSVDGGGFSATVYTQTMSDIEARLGDKAKAGQVLGNLNTVIFLRVKEPATAKYLTDQLPQITVVDSMLVTSASDVPDAGSSVAFRSSAEQRITSRPTPTLQPSDIVNLPKGQAFALLKGGQLYKIRLPLAKQTAAARDLPNAIEALMSHMASGYQSDAHATWSHWRPLWASLPVEQAPQIDFELSAPVLQPGQVAPVEDTVKPGLAAADAGAIPAAVQLEIDRA